MRTGNAHQNGMDSGMQHRSFFNARNFAQMRGIATTKRKADHIASSLCDKPYYPSHQDRLLANLLLLWEWSEAPLQELWEFDACISESSRRSQRLEVLPDALPQQDLVILPLDEALNLHEHLSLESANHPRRPDFLRYGSTKEQDRT